MSKPKPSQSKEPPITDPDRIAETLCIGRFNVTASPPLACLTFTHVRPKPGPLLETGTAELESVVRARIVTSFDNLIAMRDLLNQIIKDEPASSDVAGVEFRLN